MIGKEAATHRHEMTGAHKIHVWAMSLKRTTALNTL